MTKKNFLTIALILIGVVIIAFFGLRVFHAFKHMRGHGPFGGKPPVANQMDVSLIRDWMTVPYVAELYEVPPEAIYKSLEIPKADENSKMSLLQLNEVYYPETQGIILAHVQAVIQALQKQEPPPRFPATSVFTPTINP